MEASGNERGEDRRVLMISPFFPPETGAATHRVRLLAPHLAQYGWRPTVLSVDPRDYEGRLDPELVELLPAGLRVVRGRAWSAALTRRFGIGDLGLRSFTGLWRGGIELLREERYEALFITIFPAYTSLLGPLLKSRFRIPFVLDFIDPWVSAWGKKVGGGPHGEPDWKSRISRWLALALEPRVLRHADAITAVSAATWTPMHDRYAWLRGVPCAEIPYGGEAADYEHLRRHPRQNPWFDPEDGCFHLCYAGTLLPLGRETLRAVLGAVALLRKQDPESFRRLRLHFFGTSNQTAKDAPAQVMPVAEALGVAGCVHEVPWRIDYLDALTVQAQASAILMMGSSERHYTASKLYPGLLARRPVLAVYHEASTAAAMVRRSARPPAAWTLTYSDRDRAETQQRSIAAALREMMRSSYDPDAVDWGMLQEFSAERMAGRLAAIFDEVTGRRFRSAGAPM